MRLHLGVARGLLCATVAASATHACYLGGGGTPPPAATFYYPVGLAVSPGGRILYAANSDFDLQWNGGTLQSYDLEGIRGDAAALIQANLLTAGGAAYDGPPNEWLDASTGAAPTTFQPWFPSCIDKPHRENAGNLIP